MLDHVNADIASHTMKNVSDFSGLDDIARNEGLENFQRILAELGPNTPKRKSRIVNKSSTIGLTTEVEMVVNPMSGKGSQV